MLESDGSSTTTYSYNEQNRLTDAITTRGFVTEKVWYEYDSNGNTLVKVKETTKPVDPELTGSFVLNKAGTTITREAAFMEYDVWNQMVKTIAGDKTLTYQYNGEGYRVEKKVNDEITRYMYEADKVILEVDGQGNETARNVYGSNLLMRKAGIEQYYYMYNGHGDVTALLDTVGNIAASYYYDAFGNITEQTGEADNPVRYAGYQYDEETEIYYLNARYYDPKIARFLTEDSYRGRTSDPLSLNLYTYCNNEPMMYTDPTGNFPWLEIIIGTIIGIVNGGSGGGGNNDNDNDDDDDDDDSGSGGSSNNRSANKPKTENVNGKGGNVLSGIANMILSRIESLKSPVNIKNTQDMTGSKVNNFDFLSRYPGAVASNIITPGMYSEDTIGYLGTSNTGTRAGGIETGQGTGDDVLELMYNPYLEWYEPTEYTEEYTYWDALGDRIIVNLGLPILDAKIADSGKTPFGRVLTDEEKQLLYEKDKENWINTIMLLAVSGGKGKGKIEPPKTTVKGYRYVSEGEYNVIKKTGAIPNTDRSGNLKDVFVSPVKYDTVAGAEKGLQIGIQNPNGATSSPMYRVEFDMNEIKFRYGGNVEGGTGVELITEQPIPVDLSKIFKLK